ncbi:MAG: lytic transglycosylase domain-containing protein, partial [Clostridia bacterium]|nr:lytic transglycosylase domain-containing protein [Clostridia bacterium]
KADPPEVKKQTAGRRKTSGRHRTDRLAGNMPAGTRFLFLAVILVCLALCTALAVRSFIHYQEEQKRIAAEAAELARHPLYYGDLIMSYASRQDLDPALVAAVILCESSYNPKAESRLGARGLMQLMQDTAFWIAHKLGEDRAYSFDLLFDPETNIRFGTWYLGYLSRRYNGDPMKMICAYHAGQGNVDAWLKNPQYSPDGVTLAAIPTEDTTTYTNRVLHARDVYEKYYFPKIVEGTPLPGTPV